MSGWYFSSIGSSRAIGIDFIVVDEASMIDTVLESRFERGQTSG